MFIIKSPCDKNPPPADYQQATCDQYFKVSDYLKPNWYENWVQNFQVVSTTATQADAKAACAADGGTLAVINSQEALDWVKVLTSFHSKNPNSKVLYFKANTTNGHWIGLDGPGTCINEACNGLLTWADGSLVNFADAVLHMINGNDVGQSYAQYIN